MDNTTPRPAAPERTFSIAYQQFSGTLYNLDFRGAGTLTVQADGAGFVFLGKARALFGGDQELTLAPEHIRNVQAQGRRVQFATEAGKSGRKRRPFVFYARDAAEAAEIVALLPATRDADAVAQQAFFERLQEVHGRPGAWWSVTNIIVAANVAMFLVMGVLGAGWFDVASMTPYIAFAANRADATADGEWWRLLTSMFAHYGVIHLLLNMWALSQTGPLVEKLFGRPLYTMLYFGSGLAGGVASLLWHRVHLVWSAGASGAVFGVYGGLIGYMLRERQALPKSVFQPLLKSTLAFAGYNILFGLVSPGIDNAGHVGGLLGGMLLGWLLALPVDRDLRAAQVRRRWPLGLAATAGMVGLGVAFAPQFEYRVADELAWMEVNRARGESETALLRQQEPAFTAYTGRKDAGPVTQWLVEASAFYTRWNADLRAMRLAPGRATAKRRDWLSGILRRKLKSYEHLRIAVQQGDPRAVAVFREEDRQIAEEIAKQRTTAGRQNRRAEIRLRWQRQDWQSLQERAAASRGVGLGACRPVAAPRKQASAWGECPLLPPTEAAAFGLT